MGPVNRLFFRPERVTIVKPAARLAQRNSGDTKCKKFLYRQLCERAGLMGCRSPSCGECADYAACFGPEDVRSAPMSGDRRHQGCRSRKPRTKGVLPLISCPPCSG